MIIVNELSSFKKITCGKCHAIREGNKISGCKSTLVNSFLKPNGLGNVTSVTKPR